MIGMEWQMTIDNMKFSYQALKILKLFLERKQDEIAGSEINKNINIGNGTLYPLLSKLELKGLLKSKWENINPSVEGRPKKKFYKITEKGIDTAQFLLKAIDTVK